jgi:hypothetical protein
MIEWHGWATLSDSPSQEDCWPDPMVELVERIRLLIGSLSSSDNEVVDLRNTNGMWHLWLAGCHNHVAPEVVPLYASVAEAAPGSYGVLYVRDDESADDLNQWARWIMRRGAVYRESDASLSPHVGSIEDPFG